MPKICYICNDIIKFDEEHVKVAADQHLYVHKRCAHYDKKKAY